MKFRFVLFLSLLLSKVALGAGPLAPGDITKMTPDQIGKLDVYIVMRHAINETSTKTLNADIFTTGLIKQNMAMLFYPVDMSIFSNPDKDQKFKEQIKELQKRMGVAQTGVLLQEQFDALNRSANMLNERKVYPPPGMIITGGIPGTMGHIIAKGTWVMEDDAFPINYSEITCVMSAQNCTEVSISVSTPNQFGNDEDFNLSLTTTNYTVVSWDSNEVTAVVENDCRKTRLTINTSTKQASVVITDKTSEGCKLLTGGRLSLLGKPRVATLSDGFKEPKKFYDERTKQARKLFYEPATKAMGGL